MRKVDFWASFPARQKLTAGPTYIPKAFEDHVSWRLTEGEQVIKYFLLPWNMARCLSGFSLFVILKLLINHDTVKSSLQHLSMPDTAKNIGTHHGLIPKITERDGLTFCDLQKSLKISPGVLKHIHWCEANCARPFDSLVGCNRIRIRLKSRG